MNMKKILSFVVAFSLVAFNGFMLFEGGFASAATVSTSTVGSNVSLSYPVELDVTKEIALTCDTATTTLTPAIPGLTGGTATGARACVVVTDSIDGFDMTADATTLTSLTGSHTFANDTDVSTQTKSTFSFNYDSGSWTAFTPGTPISITSGSDHTTFAGTTSTLNFRAFVGNAINQPSGRYVSTVTVTAHMN